MFHPRALWKNDIFRSKKLFAWVVECQCYRWIYLLLSQDAPVILLVWIPLSVPLVEDFASVILTLAHALVCPMSQDRPVTIVLMDTGTWSPAEDVNHATVTLAPLTVTTVIRQETLQLLSSSCIFFPCLGSHFFQGMLVLLLENGIKNQDLGNRWPCLFYMLPSTPHPCNYQPWNKSVYLHITTRLPNSQGESNVHDSTLWHAS